MGELERVSREIVVIDGGRLLQHSTTASVTAETTAVTVEVDDDPATLRARLESDGLAVRGDGRLLEVEVADEAAYDAIRDGVAALGLGLVRIERRRHRMTEIFAEHPAGPGGGDA